jgi:hypothetical protein
LFQTESAKSAHGDTREHDLLRYRKIGFTTAEEYMNSRVLKQASTNPPRRSVRLKTFEPPKVTKAKLKRSVKYQQDQLQLYKTELVLHQRGSTITKELFGQVWEAPLSLALPDSQLPYKGNKAVTKQFYSQRYTEPAVVMPACPPGWKPDVVILEGMNMIYSPPNHIFHHTFLQYCHHLIQLYILRHLLHDKAQEIHIVFDDPDSQLVTPKLMERFRRDTKGKITATSSDNDDYLFNTITDDEQLPSNWQKFLQNRTNKKVLCQYLSTALLRIGATYLQESQKIIVAGALRDLAYSISSKSNCQIVPSLCGIHEEADTRIYLHVVNTTHRNILIYSKDSDVVHIGLGVNMEGREVMIQSKKNSTDDTFLHLTRLQKAIVDDPDLFSIPEHLRCIVVRNIFIITGCDYNSYFHSHGKIAFLTTFVKHAKMITGHNVANRDIGQFGTSVFTDEHNKHLGLLAFYRFVGCRYFDEHAVAFLQQNIETPEQLFEMSKKSTILAQHTEFLDKIREAVFTRKLLECDHLAATDALSFHWDRDTWAIQM